MVLMTMLAKYQFIFLHFTFSSIAISTFCSVVILLVRNLQGASSLACARRGWVNVDTDKIECEACGAHLTFLALASSIPQEGEFLQHYCLFIYAASVIYTCLHYKGLNSTLKFDEHVKEQFLKFLTFLFNFLQLLTVLCNRSCFLS